MADAPDGALLLLAALALDAALSMAGRLRSVLAETGRPARRLFAEIERRLNRPQRSPNTLARRGLMLTAAAAALAALAGAALHRTLASVQHGWAVELALIVLALGQRDLLAGLAGIRRALGRNGRAGGAEALARLFGGTARSPDAHGIARLACAAAAERFVLWVLAPGLGYALFGLAGLFAVTAVQSFAAVAAGEAGRQGAFGRGVAAVRDLLLWPAGWLGAACLVLAAVAVPGGRPLGAIRTVRRDRTRHDLAIAGPAVAALACGLGLALGGPGTFARGWIGDGRARVEASDLSRALYLCLLACLIGAVCLGALAAALTGLQAGVNPR